MYEQIKNGKNIYTYGPIVHNEAVAADLAGKGVRGLETKEELEQLPCQKRFSRTDVSTFVRRIQKKVEQESGEGKHIIITGNENHPEVEGIKSRCNGAVTVQGNLEEASRYVPSEGKKICVVSQTTFNYNKFHKMVEILEKRGYNVSVVNAICNATEERQRSARALAGEADVMIVIGGKHSSNTRKLYEICCEECAAAYFMQTLDDLHLDLPKAVRLVGITAGASTPNKLIEEVQNYVRINF